MGKYYKNFRNQLKFYSMFFVRQIYSLLIVCFVFFENPKIKIHIYRRLNFVSNAPTLP